VPRGRVYRAVFPFRRKRSWKRRLLATARNVPKNSRALRAAAAQLDVPWARSRPAALARESFLRFVLNPVLDYYARRRATGRDKLAGLKGPLILVANHASHLDTPVILSALPRRMRRRTVVAAAADYFYRNRLVAWLVSLIFNTTPIERNGGGLSRNGSHLDRLLDQGWNLLLFPEGTRSRSGMPGRVRRGAAVLAAAHRLTIVPIRVSGTGEAMPPGRIWPRRRRGKPVPKRHRITVSFGDPITPNDDPSAVIEAVQRFFENGEATAHRSPYRPLRIGRAKDSAERHS
jgi:1-acyl-sn-glycerol-3-phosphate acyltransferase